MGWRLGRVTASLQPLRFAEPPACAYVRPLVHLSDIGGMHKPMETDAAQEALRRADADGPPRRLERGLGVQGVTARNFHLASMEKNIIASLAFMEESPTRHTQ